MEIDIYKIMKSQVKKDISEYEAYLSDIDREERESGQKYVLCRKSFGEMFGYNVILFESGDYSIEPFNKALSLT